MRVFKKAQNPTSALWLIALALSILSTPLQAAKKTKAPEIYSAVEDEVDPSPSAPKAQAKAPRATPKAQAANPNPVKAEKAEPLFDQVPAEQVEGIANRLKLIDTLLRKYGRAYDYRTHTFKELEKILAQLEGPPPADAEPTLPAPPAEKPQDPQI